MLNRLKKLIVAAKSAGSNTANAVGDLNGDGVVDEKDAQIAAKWFRQTAGDVADEAARLGKEVVRSKMVKDATTGAAIGAVVAVPVPIVGPIAGATVGAGLGIYKNIMSKAGDSPYTSTTVDVHAQLLKLADLRDKGLLTDAEFEEQKRKLLKDSVG
jgi:hypothetical protein